MLVRAALSADHQPMEVDGATGGAEGDLLTFVYDVLSGRAEQPVSSRGCQLAVWIPLMHIAAW